MPVGDGRFKAQIKSALGSSIGQAQRASPFAVNLESETYVTAPCNSAKRNADGSRRVRQGTATRQNENYSGNKDYFNRFDMS
jgi:hypothetical protein